MSDDAKDALSYWIRLGNRYGGYGHSNYRTNQDKQIIEASIAREWRRALYGVYGVEVTKLILNPQDPPDCFATLSDTKLGLELVQMVEGRHKRRADTEKRGNMAESPYRGQMFLDTQWTAERFQSHLSKIIAKKGRGYGTGPEALDILLIHTEEPWLRFEDVEKWLGAVAHQPIPSIKTVFLLLDYDPSYRAAHWPLFRIYGDLGGRLPVPKLASSPEP